MGNEGVGDQDGAQDKQVMKPSFSFLPSLRAVNWQAWVFSAALLLMVFLQLYTYSNMHHLPGPLYGGDLYRNRAFVMNLLDGNPPWTDSYFLDAAAYYPWLAFGIESQIIKASGLSVDGVLIFFPILGYLLFAVALYCLGKLLFEDKTWALLLGILAIAGSPVGVNPVQFAFAFLMFSFYFWLRLEKDGGWKNALFLGISITFAGFFRASEMLYVVALFALCIIIKCCYDAIHAVKQKSGGIGTLFITYLKKYLLVPVVVFVGYLPIALPLYLYHGFKVLNPVTKYGETGVEHLGPVWLLKTAFHMMLNTANMVTIVLSLATLLGLVVIILNRKRFSQGWLLSWLLLTLLLTQHHLLTRPLFNTWFVPGKFMMLWIFIPIIQVYGLREIHKNLQKFLNLKLFAVFCILLLAIPLLFLQLKTITNDRWYSYGLLADPHITEMYKLGDWAMKNIPSDVAVLANDEDGFALTAVSGKKVLAARRTHVSYYVDIDQRIADAAIIIYGNNSVLRKQLLEQYNLHYFYAGPMLFQQAMLVPARFKPYLDENGVDSALIRERLDIAVPDAEVFDLAQIPPQNLSVEFASSLQGVYQAKTGNAVLGQIFSIS